MENQIDITVIEPKIDNSRYNTNLASEFLIMSLLCRVGKEPYLSLGNKKGVDIILPKASGQIAILEVKGVAGKMDWIIGNGGQFSAAKNLFYILVGFEGKISDLRHPGMFYCIPSELIKNAKDFKLSTNQKTVYISYKVIKEKYLQFLNNFNALED